MIFSKIFNRQKGFIQHPLGAGFTLIELLVVIGILAILLAITLIAINPARQFAQANNTKRTSDVNAILNAINQYMADNKGNVPAAITGTATEIGSTAGLVNICVDLVTKYMAALPSDPKSGSPQGSVINCGAAHNTRYRVVKSGTDNRITVDAMDPELPPITISATR